MLAFLPGLLAGLSLIVAIGAQNAFLLRQGLTRQHVLLVVAICASADVLLIAVGIAGLGAVIESSPILLEAIRWFGVAYLLWFAARSVIAATKHEALNPAESLVQSRGKIALTTLALTFLNPHVYLDTVIMLGSIANQFGQNRWYFGFGAMVASVLWFFTVGFGAKAASKFLTSPRFWRALDIAVAAIMLALAVTLAFMKL